MYLLFFDLFLFSGFPDRRSARRDYDGSRSRGELSISAKDALARLMYAVLLILSNRGRFSPFEVMGVCFYRFFLIWGYLLLVLRLGISELRGLLVIYIGLVSSMDAGI